MSAWSCRFGLGLTVVLLIGSAGTFSAADDAATVEVMLPQYIYVDAQDIYDWGKGHTAGGVPGAGNGEDPFFNAGEVDDMWIDGFDVPNCNGAVGCSDLIIKTNVNWRAKVNPYDIQLALQGGSGSIPGAAQIGIPEPGFGIYLYQDTGFQLKTGNTPPELYLYATARRRGLNDTAGLYTDTTTVHVVVWLPSP